MKELVKTVPILHILESMGYEMKGRKGMYLSPFRNEAAPSFHIDSRLNVWYDFGRGEGGDNIRLVQLLRGCGFKEAINFISGVRGSCHASLAGPEDIHPKIRKSGLVPILVTDIINPALLDYAASRGIMPLMDNGHYHPTESIYDKISSMLLFNKNLALHITRPVRWDSDHVILFNDEVKEICKEITRCDDISRIKIATDYFDASINRIAAWVIGIRNVQKALLFGLLQPNKTLYDLQMKSKFTQLMFLQEEIKTYPFGDVWNEFCNRNNVIGSEEWFKEIEDYEKNVLVKRV